MKCPYCKKPVHVSTLILAKNRSKMQASKASLRSKAETATTQRNDLMLFLKHIGVNETKMSDLLNISHQRINQILKKHRFNK